MKIPIDPENPEFREAANEIYVRWRIKQMAFMKFMLRAHRWNLDKDRRLARVLGIKEPLTLEWYLREALKECSSSYKL